MGLGLGLGRELGNDGIQVNILDNGVFATASNVGESGVITNATSEGFDFTTDGVTEAFARTVITVHNGSSSNYGIAARYKVVFDVVSAGNISELRVKQSGAIGSFESLSASGGSYTSDRLDPAGTLNNAITAGNTVTHTFEKDLDVDNEFHYSFFYSQGVSSQLSITNFRVYQTLLS